MPLRSTADGAWPPALAELCKHHGTTGALFAPMRNAAPRLRFGFGFSRGVQYAGNPLETIGRRQVQDLRARSGSIWHPGRIEATGQRIAGAADQVSNRVNRLPAAAGAELVSDAKPSGVECTRRAVSARYRRGVDQRHGTGTTKKAESRGRRSRHRPSRHDRLRGRAMAYGRRAAGLDGRGGVQARGPGPDFPQVHLRRLRGEARPASKASRPRAPTRRTRTSTGR